MTADYCTFGVRGLFLGVPVRAVQEVLRAQEPTPVPGARPVVTGLLNLRGDILAAVDLRRRLGLGDAGRPPEAMTIVLRAGREAVAFVVDEVGDVVTAGDALAPAPETVPGTVRAAVAGVHELADRLLLVLDPARLMALD